MELVACTVGGGVMYRRGTACAKALGWEGAWEGLRKGPGAECEEEGAESVRRQQPDLEELPTLALLAGLGLQVSLSRSLDQRGVEGMSSGGWGQEVFGG